MFREIMSIFIANAMSQFSRLQDNGNPADRAARLLSRISPHSCGFENGVGGRIALWVHSCHIQCCLGRESIWDSGMPMRSTAWAAATATWQCLGICISHVFGGTDHDSSGNKRHALSCIQHPGQIINRRIRVGSPHAFDKRRNRVVMVVPGFIIPHHSLLDAFRRHIHESDVNFSVRTAGSVVKHCPVLPHLMQLWHLHPAISARKSAASSSITA